MEAGYVMCRDAERKYGPLHGKQIRGGVVPDGYSMLPRSYVMARDDLVHDGRRAIMFGDFGIERMAVAPSADVADEMDVDDDVEQSVRS
jgi:hypothetical protein